MIVQKILEQANKGLSGNQIHQRAKNINESIHRCTISTILNKMHDKGKVEYDTEQVDEIRIKFWRLK